MELSRKRGRTTLIVATAALLGVVAGTATGYAVQANRAPVALPPLNQPELAYPAKSLPKGKEPAPLPVAQDSRVKTDGDLRKLLISKPKGATYKPTSRDAADWLSLDSYAQEFTGSSTLFKSLAPDFRRGATVSWLDSGNREVTVNLIQFKPGVDEDAHDFVEDQSSYMPNANEAGNGGSVIKGTDDGRYWVYDNPQHLPVNTARALAWRGDVVMEIFVLDDGTIPASVIRTLAEQQLGRL